jgi:hypothetical protein
MRSEPHGSCSGERARQLGEDRQVGAQSESGMTPMMCRVLLLVLAVALIAAGCGKEGLQQQRFNTAAHVICKELEAVINSPGFPVRAKWLGDRIRALTRANRSLPLVARYLHDGDRLEALRAQGAFGVEAERLRKRRRAELRALGITSCLGAEPHSA